MISKRRKEVTIEMRRVTVIRNGQHNLQFTCRLCSAYCTGLTVIQAAAALNVDQHSIFRLLGSDEIHALNTFDRTLLICKRSVADYGSHESQVAKQLIAE